jgi:hypothetical protein
MTFHEDPDLEGRLRRIADQPQPPVPESVYRYAGEVARHKGGSRMRFSFRLGRGLSPLASAVGVIDAIAVAVLVAGLVLSVRTNLAAPQSPPASSAASIGPVVTPSAGPTPSYFPTPTVRPTPTGGPVGFTTPGVLTGWTGFSWKSGQNAGGNSVSRIIRWRGGYVATDSEPGRSLWTSSDGETWTPVRSLPDAWIFVSAAPGGLVAIAMDYGSSSESAPASESPSAASVSATVWTSTDGVVWDNAGKPNFSGTVGSVAGDQAGIVATVISTSSCMVEFSLDGLTWSPETVESTLDCNRGLTIQSSGSRIFLMGATTAGLTRTGGAPRIVLASTATYSYVWWSDDGRTWTRSGGFISGFGTSIDFGRDGMLLNTDFDSTPGGVGMALSSDGGKSWQPYDTFGPLGVAPCGGECSVQPDGVIGSNGTVFVAVQNGGKKAWLSYDGHTWSAIAWAGGDPSSASYNGFGGFTVLPRGVLLTGVYGAAK